MTGFNDAEYRAWSRAEHERSARLHALSPTDRDIVRIANRPGFGRWQEQIRATGGCANPVYLTGSTTIRDTATGAVVAHYSTEHEPGGRLAVRCRNRRASVCPSCSYEHQGDTYHLIRAGLVGGKGVPAEVRDSPRLFVTLTAPSFGTVHRATSGGERCHPRRDRGTCEHGAPLGCPARHGDDDRRIGQPLCVACYDYAAHVLWHAHAGALWDTFVRTLRRRLATRAGVARSRLRDVLVVAFGKVAEYQARGAVHVHAVVRLDGPDGPGSSPPTWATAELVADLVRDAAAAVRVYAPETDQLGSPVLRWGAQLDVRPLVRPLRAELGGDDAVSDDAVASYVAKYTTKASSDAGAGDTRIRDRDEIALMRGTDHARALMRAAWDLGGIPELGGLRLRAWAHTYGYRGHVLTKSRTFSTTYQALRAARRDWRAAAHGVRTAPDTDTVTESAWHYAGSGHTVGEAAIAAGIAEDLARMRDVLRALRYVPAASRGVV
ncbi:plasmid replication initiator protein [Yinghuangia sp. ASG 101]|uniref:replication initiator n=1 Tax=Yinghuangia sp. ASG 101 TaxID=2896848 RepID=UPI001E5AFA7F|nr:replication initiator [Yinghuangia sp. ASG 101]UGQ09359.1 plasmid replication initiator protein [Yinghuangia sp. ASG 101]